MRCAITGKEADMKWKDIPLVKSAYIAALAVREKNPGITMRQAIKAIAMNYKKFKSEHERRNT